MQDSILTMLRVIFTNQEVAWLGALLIANLVLGIVASIRQRDFQLTRVGDWLYNRLLPLFASYGVASFLAYVNPAMEYVKLAAVATLVAAMLGYVLKNLRDFGVDVEENPTNKPAG